MRINTEKETSFTISDIIRRVFCSLWKRSMMKENLYERGREEFHMESNEDRLFHYENITNL